MNNYDTKREEIHYMHTKSIELPQVTMTSEENYIYAMRKKMVNNRNYYLQLVPFKLNVFTYHQKEISKCKKMMMIMQCIAYDD